MPRCLDDDEDSAEATTLLEPGGGDTKFKKAYFPGPVSVPEPGRALLLRDVFLASGGDAEVTGTISRGWLRQLRGNL